jgi:hypothetical protein
MHRSAGLLRATFGGKGAEAGRWYCMVTSSWLAGGVRSWGKHKPPLSRRGCRRATQASIGGVTTAIHPRSLSRMCRHSVDGLLSPGVACTRFSRVRTSTSIHVCQHSIIGVPSTPTSISRVSSWSLHFLPVHHVHTSSGGRAGCSARQT